jgi:hypothetical protein
MSTHDIPGGTVRPELQRPALSGRGAGPDDPTLRQLVSEIEARSEALATWAVAEMYRNPFWDERFGARGRHFAEQDGLYHLSYLAHALWGGSPSVLTGYARWLQTVLTHRGMCSLHIAEQFSRIEAAILHEGIAAPDRAIAYLREAVEAVRYPGGPGRILQDVAPQVAQQVVNRLYARHPEWLHQSGESGRTHCLTDAGYHLSYLADAVANERPAGFVEYVTWIAGFLDRRGVLPSHLTEMLDAIALELERLDHLGPIPSAMLVEARSSLAAPTT